MTCESIDATCGTMESVNKKQEPAALDNYWNVFFQAICWQHTTSRVCERQSIGHERSASTDFCSFGVLK